MNLYQTKNGTWAGTQALAAAAALEDGSGKGNWQPVEVPTHKPGLINWLNAQRNNQDQERNPAPLEHSSPRKPQALEPMTEDDFEALPLAMQLHLAALAVENARDKINA